MDKPPILDEIMKTIQYLEDLTKDPDPRIDPRWFADYKTREDQRRLKVVHPLDYQTGIKWGEDDGEEK